MLEEVVESVKLSDCEQVQLDGFCDCGEILRGGDLEVFRAVES